MLKKKFKSLNGYKNKYERKGRRSNLDFVEKKGLIDYLYVGGYGSRRRGGLKPGSQIPRHLSGDPKTSISVVEASSRAGIKLSTAKSINRLYVESGYKFLTRNDAIAARKPRRKKLKGLESYLMRRLEDWVHFPLSRRVEIIAEELGSKYKVTPKTLSNFYKKVMNVRYRRPSYHISNIYSEIEMVKL